LRGLFFLISFFLLANQNPYPESQTPPRSERGGVKGLEWSGSDGGDDGSRYQGQDCQRPRRNGNAESELHGSFSLCVIAQKVTRLAFQHFTDRF
jgi:hypothetical protein